MRPRFAVQKVHRELYVQPWSHRVRECAQHPKPAEHAAWVHTPETQDSLEFLRGVLSFWARGVWAQYKGFQAGLRRLAWSHGGEERAYPPKPAWEAVGSSEQKPKTVFEFLR